MRPRHAFCFFSCRGSVVSSTRHHVTLHPLVRKKKENLLRRNWSSKTSKNWRIVHASSGESYECESIVDSDSRFTEQSKLRQTQEVFYDTGSGSSSGATHVKVNLLLLWVPEPCLPAIRDCRKIHGIQVAEEGRPSTVFNNSKNLGIRYLHTRWKNCLHPHAVLQNQIRNILWKWQKLRNHGVLTQNTHWRSSTACGKVWWLDHCR